MNIKEYIRKAFRDDPELADYDISPGSNLHDMIIVPLEKVFEDGIKTFLRTDASQYDINNTDNMTYGQLVRMARQHGIAAPSYNASTGHIVFLFNSAASDIVIPAGTQIKGGGAMYYVLGEEHVLSSFLQSNPQTEEGYYQSQPIHIESPDGIGVSENQLNVTNLNSPYLAGMRHPAIPGGTSPLSDAQLSSLIKATIQGIYNGTAQSITAMINNIEPTIKNIKVVVAGDKLMTRDRLVNAYIYDAPAKNRQDFNGKVYGDNKTNKNNAYYGFGDSATPPSIDALYGKTEISQYQYICISNYDAFPVTISTSNIFMDTFASNNTLFAQHSVDNPIGAGDTSFYSYDNTWVQPGNTVNMQGKVMTDEPIPVEVLSNMQVMVRDVIYKRFDITAISETLGLYSVTISGLDTETYKNIREGMIFDLKWVKLIGKTEFNGTVSIAPGGIPTNWVSGDIVIGVNEDAESGLLVGTGTGKAEWIEYRIMGAFTENMTDAFVSAPENIATQVGGGWITSEHGYPIGHTIIDNEIYVENEIAVLGGQPGIVDNPVKDIIYQNGIPRFVSAVLNSIKVRKTKSQEQAIAIVDAGSTQEMER